MKTYDPNLLSRNNQMRSFQGPMLSRIPILYISVQMPNRFKLTMMSLAVFSRIPAVPVDRPLRANWAAREYTSFTAN